MQGMQRERGGGEALKMYRKFWISSKHLGEPWQVRPSYHAMARPRVADGGTASNMEGSCEYME